MIKQTHHYTKQDDIYLNDEHTIKTNNCGHIQVKFTVDARHLALAIMELIEGDYDFGSDTGGEYHITVPKLSRNKVEEELRKQLLWNGERFQDILEAGLDEMNTRKLPYAIDVGKKLFPEFFNVPNSIKFMKDLA